MTPAQSASPSAASPAPPLPRRTSPVADLEPVADGVWLLRGGFKHAMNVVLIEDPDGGVVLFDAGERGMAAPILAAAERLGGLRRVVLGHADNDHRGAAPYLGVPVLCHPLEIAAAEAGGHRDYWDLRDLPLPINLLHRFLMWRSWEGGPVRIAGTVREGDEIAGFRVVELPGHAPGLIGLWREADGVALVSDALYMTSMLGRPQDPAVPEAAYNHDGAQAAASIGKLADLGPRIVVPGHAGPLTEDVVPALRRAARG
jgi:glyoxylase-like metal-dependent hydrolase (beta-lactamase superfamily II)